MFWAWNTLSNSKQLQKYFKQLFQIVFQAENIWVQNVFSLSLKYNLKNFRSDEMHYMVLQLQINTSIILL